MSYLKDEAIIVKCLAQGHTGRHRPGRDSNPHSDNNKLESDAIDRSATTFTGIQLDIVPAGFFLIYNFASGSDEAQYFQ